MTTNIIDIMAKYSKLTRIWVQLWWDECVDVAALWIIDLSVILYFSVIVTICLVDLSQVKWQKLIVNWNDDNDVDDDDSAILNTCCSALFVNGRVSSATESSVVSSEAYILFYELSSSGYSG